MLNRRDFLRGATLLSVGTLVPRFLVNTARAAEAGKDTVLVVIELTGGNDGLNTVIPYADELYHKARPTLKQTRNQVLRIDDTIGFHSAMKGLDKLVQTGQVAVVQGVGVPNPDRSHFESMDVWQSAQTRRKDHTTTGWLARSASDLANAAGGVPLLQIGTEKLPVALTGSPQSVATLSDPAAFRLNVGAPGNSREAPRKRLLEQLAKIEGKEDESDLLQFVQRRQLQTYTTLEQLKELLKDSKPLPLNQPQQPFQPTPAGVFQQKMQLVARIIALGLGTRVFYVALDGFDTHSSQAEIHSRLLKELADALAEFFGALQKMGHDKRVLAMTFSEFGRRVQENGSRGTDHGAGSCLLVAGPGVKGGAIGKHPRLDDLDQGDLKHHTDFRQVYATILDGWLGCDSKAILGANVEPLDLIK